MEKETNTPRRGNTSNMIRLICRSIEIGDSSMAKWSMKTWGFSIEEEGDLDKVRKLANAKDALVGLLAHEAIHGRFSMLDREAPEVVLYEHQRRRDGLPSVYQTDGRSAVPEISRAV